MATMTEPLRREHRELLPKVDLLRSAADAVGTAPPAEVRARVAAAHDFLTRELIVHATAEDEVLYPAVDAILHAPVTPTMRRDHVEVARLTSELAALLDRLDDRPVPHDLQAALRRVLYGLHAIVRLHFAKEEEVYLPLLDEHLGRDAADTLFADMERAAHVARSAAGDTPREGFR